MPLPSFLTTVTRKATIADRTIEFSCEKPNAFTFRAGQFVMFDAPLMESPADIQPRAYSIASAPHENELLFVVKLKEGGRFSRYLSNVITIGTSLRMQGPLGVFTIRPSDHHIVLVATGSGIAPFRSQILCLLRENDLRPLTLIMGVRHPQEWIWLHEFRVLSEAHPMLRILPCLSGGDPEWTGLRGRVTEHLAHVIENPITTDLYACGSPAMVKDVQALAMSLGVPKAQAHIEGYI